MRVLTLVPEALFVFATLAGAMFHAWALMAVLMLCGAVAIV